MLNLKHTLTGMLFCAFWAVTSNLHAQNYPPSSPEEVSAIVAQLEYVNAFESLAQDEMKRSGVPASIKLAQAILESKSGQSQLAQEANNHFGIKCDRNWPGLTAYKNDDEFDDEGKPVLSCFRRYNTAAESYADHSRFLKNPKKQYRYGFLFKLDKTDYVGWAAGLDSAGYSPVDNYGAKLINIIERYRLYEIDTAVLPAAKTQNLMVENLTFQSTPMLPMAAATPDEQLVYEEEKLPSPDMLYTVNRGETLFAIARKFETTVGQLKRLNKLQNDDIKAGQQLKVR